MICAQEVSNHLQDSEIIAIVETDCETYAWHIDDQYQLRRIVFREEVAYRDSWSYDLDCCYSTETGTVLCTEESR